MAKPPPLMTPQVTTKPAGPSPSQVLHSATFKPTRDDLFRMKRTAGTLWCIEVTRLSGSQVVFRVELDPPDTIGSIQRKCSALVSEAERR